jgi:Tol biopolymer transport system component
MNAFLQTWQRPAIAVLAAFTLPAAADSFQLISQPNAGLNAPAGGGGDSSSAILSADGRYVLFASIADNLVVISNPGPASGLQPHWLNVFLRDRTNVATTLVSVNTAGNGGGDGNSLPAGLSTNNRYVLFESAAGNLVANDTNSVGDVFVRDLVGGVTERVSVSTNGGCGNRESRSPVMTPDGRYVAFVSEATNLVAGDTNGIADVFVRDRQAGTTTLVSVGAKSTGSYLLPSGSESPEITPDGHYVAFYSTATNLAPGVSTAGEIYVRDLVADSTVCASTSARTICQLLTGTTNAVSFNHTISADGRFVAFETSTNALTPSHGRGIIFRYDLLTDLIDIVHANAHVPAAPYQDIHNLDMTSDGQFIVFIANVGSAAGTNTAVYLWDEWTETTTLVSGNLSNALPPNALCDWPRVDASGRYVAFLCNATNLVTNSLVGDFHLYIRDTQSGVTRLINAGTNGAGTGVNPSTPPALSADGRLVAFECPDGNLIADDRNRADDVFVRDLVADTTELISSHHPC